MKALLIYGLKFGEDNKALQQLGEKIKELGVEVTFAHWDDPSFPIGPEIRIGHSFGGPRAIQYSNLIQTQYVALIDPVADWFPVQLWNYWKKFTIPENISKCDCFTRSFNLLPPSGSIANADGERFRNYPNIRASHDAIPNAPIVVETILKQIKGML